jgi:hypothetical protein
MPRQRYDWDDDDDDRPRRGDRSGSGVPIGLVIGGVGTLLAVLVVIAVVLVRTSRREDAAEEADTARRAEAADPRGNPVWPGPQLPQPLTKGGPVPELPNITRPRARIGVPMPAGTPTASQLAFGGGEGGFVALVSSEGPLQSSRIDVARAATGEAVGTVEVGFAANNGLALSPDGKLIAVRGDTAYAGDPVTIFPVDRRGPGTKFVPYPTGNGGDRLPLAWVGFVGPGRLITVNDRSGFDVWSVPGLKRLCGQPPRRAGSTPFVSSAGIGWSPQNLALAEDGKTLALFDGTGFTFYDTATATPKAKTEPLIRPGGSANFWGSAVRADGTRFACSCSVYDPKGTTALFVWDVATGKRLSATPVPEATGSGGFGWWGPDHLLLYGALQMSAEVWSFEHGRVVSEIRALGTANIRIAAATPGDKLWFVFDGSALDPRGVAPVLVKVPEQPFFRRQYAVGPDGLQER